MLNNSIAKIFYFTHLKKSKNIKIAYNTDNQNSNIYNFILNKIGKNAKLKFIEFRTYRGWTMNFFSTNFINPETTFVGFDSFEGLPDTNNHRFYYKKMFDIGEKFPFIDDSRVSFVKGFFSERKEEIRHHLYSEVNNFLIHFDADLFSSTLLTLFLCSNIKEYYCLFDEFGDDEARALYYYLDVNNSSFEVYATTYDYNFNLSPKQVFGKIINK